MARGKCGTEARLRKFRISFIRQEGSIWERIQWRLIRSNWKPSKGKDAREVRPPYGTSIRRASPRTVRSFITILQRTFSIVGRVILRPLGNWGLVSQISNVSIIGSSPANGRPGRRSAYFFREVWDRNGLGHAPW